MIFRIKGIYFSISFYFIFMLIWVIFTGKVKAFSLCLFALILHELGHILVAYFLGERVSVFYILPFGFCCRLKNQSKIKRKNMFRILIAGPATSVFVAGLFAFWTKEFAFVNLLLGLFNLLPIGKLDGGRMFSLLV